MQALDKDMKMGFILVPGGRSLSSRIEKYDEWLTSKWINHTCTSLVDRFCMARQTVIMSACPRNSKFEFLGGACPRA